MESSPLEETKVLQSSEQRWKIATAIACAGLLAMTAWNLFFTGQNTAGKIIRSVADTSTLAKGIVGNWYSYNRNYDCLLYTSRCV